MNPINDPKFQKLTDKFFWESFYGIFIFGIPAFSALYLGKMLDVRYNSGYTWKLILLLSAFLFSWVMVFYRNRRLTKMYREFRASQQAELAQKPEVETK